MLLENIFGGGNTSSPPATTHPAPAAPASTEPAPETDADPVDDPANDPSEGPAEDDVPVDSDDGTYLPAPAPDPEEAGGPDEVGAEQPPAEPEPVGDEPVVDDGSNGEEVENVTPEPESDMPVGENGEELPADDETVVTEPAPAPPAQPSPAVGAPASPSPEDGLPASPATSPSTAIQADPVKRVTDLIADYETLLAQPEGEGNAGTDQARVRAMELAQNRVLTGLISSLSTADARSALAPITDATEIDQVSLITRYYAEAGR